MAILVRATAVVLEAIPPLETALKFQEKDRRAPLHRAYLPQQERSVAEAEVPEDQQGADRRAPPHRASRVGCLKLPHLEAVAVAADQGVGRNPLHHRP